MYQFTAMFSSDEVVSAGEHSLEEFEPELARVSSIVFFFFDGS